MTIDSFRRTQIGGHRLHPSTQVMSFGYDPKMSGGAGGLAYSRFNHPNTERAVYDRQCTGPGSTFALVVESDQALAFRIVNGLQLFKLAVSLGGTESLVCHPASTTHSGETAEARERAGVTEGLIRLSVGQEHPDDLIADLKAALEGAVRG